MWPDAAREMRGQGGFLEVQLRTQPRPAANRYVFLWNSNSGCANREHPWCKLSRPGHLGSTGWESVLGQRAFKARSGGDAAFVAGGH
jgi:hypothetical protein